jgi:RNA polymerase sigma-70 factor (ECF subfamily)
MQRIDLCRDRAWLDAFRAGEPAALERVFRTYAAYVCAIIRSGVTADGHLAPGYTGVVEQEDLLQEVFVRLLSPEMRQRYDGLRPFAAFAAGVTRHVVIDHARRSGRLQQRMLSMEDESRVPDNWSPDEPLPEDLLLAAEERQLVATFLAELDGETRRFVELRFAQGLAQRDVAEQLGRGRQQIRTMERNIREQMRDFLRLRGL